jgi:hypothetical protein
MSQAQHDQPFWDRFEVGMPLSWQQFAACNLSVGFHASTLNATTKQDKAKGTVNFLNPEQSKAKGTVNFLNPNKAKGTTKLRGQSIF